MKRLLIIAGLFFFIINVQAQLQVTNLRCEYSENPLGIETAAPHFNWQLQSTQKNVLQTACKILVADDSFQLKNGNAAIWNSNKIQSAASIQMQYAGKPLQAAKKYFWKVWVWDNKGNVAESDVAYWQMGLLTENDWKQAQWIAYKNLPDSLIIVPAEHGNGKKEWGKRPDVLPLFRKEFTINKSVKLATAFICGLGQFELSVNGEKTGNHFLDPGWTKYNQQAQYVTFNITSQVKQGTNAVGVMLGNGFYYIPSERYRKMTGAYGYPKIIARVLIEYTDGSTENIVSNNSWKTAASPITFSSLYGGETYDATLEQKGWNQTGFDDSKWQDAVIATPHQLVAQTAPPVKVMEEFGPAKTNQLNNHTWVYDFGQNMSGIPQITVQGRKGDTIKITTAELLKDDGTVNQKATGSPSYYQYILNGTEMESWQPCFSYYGFRYAQAEILPKDNDGAQTKIIAIKALHTRNSAATTGSFTCSNELFNKTYSLIEWAVNSNMQSVFTDCPHRERLGWQEQLHLMGNALQHTYDIHTLGKKITADIRAEQNENGLIPSTVPEYTQIHFADGYFRDSPEWGSNGILMPWNLYKWYGDKEELEKNYTAMQRYANYLRSKDSSYLLMYGLSDWYDLGPNRPGFCQLTPMGLTATAYYYNDLQLMNKMALLLNKQADAKRYALWADSVKQAFNKMYFHKLAKQYGSGSQTSNAIAISFGLVNEKDKSDVLQNIIKDIEQHSYALTCGDIGFHHLLKVLSAAGRNDMIFKMNNRTDVPGYGYQLAKGATALTESWQGLPIVSNNHFMLGHLMDWFYSGLAGIQQSGNSVAYKSIVIKPQPVGDITFAKATYQSVYGEVVSYWKIDNGVFELNVTIPANTSAMVYLPGSKKALKTGSGNYSFSVKMK